MDWQNSTPCFVFLSKRVSNKRVLLLSNFCTFSLPILLKLNFREYATEALLIFFPRTSQGFFFLIIKYTYRYFISLKWYLGIGNPCELMRRIYEPNQETFNYKVFSFLRFSNKAKRDIKFRHSTRSVRIVRIRRKLANRRDLMGRETLYTRSSGSFCLLCQVRNIE